MAPARHRATEYRRSNRAAEVTVAAAPVFTSRLSGRQLLDGEGVAIGKVRDVVILPSAGGEPPWVLGLVVTLQRREIFVNLGRISEVAIDGVRLRGGTIDLRRFSRRAGELLASELYSRRAGTGRVADIGIAPSASRRGGWEVTALAISHGPPFGLNLRNSTTIVPWDKYHELFKAGPLAEQLIQLREMHPTDLANAIEIMSAARRRELAEALHDEELADLLEEMPEQDQRRLLRYDATTAGGLMTSHPLIMPPDTPVAEVLAQIRVPETAATVAAQVYVCEPPSVAPPGRSLGTVGFQRLLRMPPATTIGDCVEESGFVPPDLPEKEVARRMAAYNLIGVAVCDETGRLLGAITVDDVLDRILPTDWRKAEAT